MEHIARHGVTPQEFEEALFSDRDRLLERVGPIERNPNETIYRCLGGTEAGRYLFMEMLRYANERRADGEALPVMARDMTERAQEERAMSEAKGQTASEKDAKRRVEELAEEERRVVDSGSVEEIADLYDRTDTGDLPWEEADDVVIERPELEQISIRLPKEDLDALRRRAAKSGVGYTTLIRMIVRAHLDNPLAY